MRLATFAIIAVMFCSQQTIAQDDPIKSRLVAAKQEYENDLASAREALVKLLKAKETEAQKAGDLQLLEDLRGDEAAFESKDVLPRSVQTRTYNESVKKARRKLQDAYVLVRKAYTQKGQIDDAKRVDSELQEFNNSGLGESKIRLETDDKAPIDLLKLVEPKLDSVRGQWRRKGESLISPNPFEDEGRLCIPVCPNGNYELLIRFTRLKGPHGPGVTLPIGPRQVNFVLGDVGKYSGLQKLDGKFFRDQTNPTRVPGIRLMDNKEYTLIAHVTMNGDEPGRIQIDLDGKPVIDWTGRPSQFSMDSNWILPDNHAFGLHAWETDFRFDTIQLRMLSGEAKRPWGTPAKRR